MPTGIMLISLFENNPHATINLHVIYTALSDENKGLLTRIAEVRTTVTEIAGYTRHRQTEEQQRKEHEAELLAQAENAGPPSAAAPASTRHPPISARV